jgi:6-phosphogluconolactonase
VRARGLDVVVEADKEAAARRVAEILSGAARDGAEIALTGGSTPGRAYELAAELEANWSAAGLWWGDERCVPPDYDDSNFGLAQKTLLDNLREPLPSVHRIRGEEEPDAAAAAYAEELRGVTLDLVLLGLGPDGHVASLFPHAPGLQETERLVIASEPKLEPFVERVTLTPPALVAAQKVVFLVTGDEKAEACEAAFAGEPSPSVPGSLIRSRAGETVAVLDEAAASRLRD